MDEEPVQIVEETREELNQEIVEKPVQDNLLRPIYLINRLVQNREQLPSFKELFSI